MKLINSVHTPNSILKERDKYIPINIGNRPRLATCTAVCWIAHNIIASLNLYGNTIFTYSYDSEKNIFTPLQEITNKDGARLSMSEHMSISPCKKYLAICSDFPSACVNIYIINELINPIPIFTIQENCLIHNVRFTSDGKYLSYVTFNKIKSVKIFKVILFDNIFNLENVFSMDNEYESIRAKAINFTKDGKYAIICYSTAAIDSINGIKSCIASYKFYEDGRIGDKISEIHGEIAIEDAIFINNDNNIIVSDQSNDVIINYEFDKVNGVIGKIHSKIENPDGSISFPHGMCISDDGKYLAVANYGNDEFNLYEA